MQPNLLASFPGEPGLAGFTGWTFQPATSNAAKSTHCAILAAR